VRRQVYYAWHPLCGQTVIVCREVVRLSVAVAECRLVGQEHRRGPSIPQWMFDRAVCSGMFLADKPRVHWQSLADLRRLLDAVAAPPVTGVVELGHPCSRRSRDAP
jgi:hypothetical protein